MAEPFKLPRKQEIFKPKPEVLETGRDAQAPSAPAAPPKPSAVHKVPELTFEDRAKGFTSVTLVAKGKRSKKGVVREYFIIDPQTGRSIGSIDRIAFERQQLGQRKFSGVRFVTVAPPEEIAASVRRLEEKREGEELARKEAEFEFQRIQEGKIREEDVVLTQRGASRFLSERLAEEEEAEEPVEIREKELLVRRLAPGTREPVGELLPRKELRGKVEIGELETFRGEITEEEEITPRNPLELFSQEAQAQFGLTETRGGLLEIAKDGRKIVIQRVSEDRRERDFLKLVNDPFGERTTIEKGVVIADLPESAQFSLGFESKLGTGKPSLIGLKTKDGVLPFSTIGKIFEEKEEAVSKVTGKFVPLSFFEMQRAVVDVKLKELEGERGKIAAIRRTKLQIESFALGIPSGGFRQIREQPIQSSLIFGLGAVGAPLLTKIGKIPLANKLLGGAFVGFTGAEAGVRLKRGEFGEAGAIIGERVLEAGLFVGGTQLGARISQIGKPPRVLVTKAKGLEGEFAEALKVEGRTARGLKRFELPTETKIRVTKAKVSAFTKRVPIPKDRQALSQLISQEDIRFQFVFEKTTGLPKQVLVKDFPASVRRFTLKAEPFEIKIDGKLTTRLGGQGVIVSKDVEGITRIIDPKLVKQIPGEKGFTILERETIETLPKRGLQLIAGLKGQARITGKVTKKVEGLTNIFGIDLLPPVTVETTTTTQQLIRGPILSVKPLFEPAPLLLVPTNIFDIISNLKRKPVLDLTRVSDTYSISRLRQASIQRQKPISDVSKIIESIQDVTPVQEPIIDVTRDLARTPISDVISGLRQRTIQEPVKPPVPEFELPRPPPPPGLFLPMPRLFLGDPIKRKRMPLKQMFAFTPDLIASVLGQFGPQPKQKLFTGQERRFIPLTGKFISPLPKQGRNPFDLIINFRNNLLGVPVRRPRKKRKKRRKR